MCSQCEFQHTIYMSYYSINKSFSFSATPKNRQCDRYSMWTYMLWWECISSTQISWNDWGCRYLHNTQSTKFLVLGYCGPTVEGRLEDGQSQFGQWKMTPSGGRQRRLRLLRGEHLGLRWGFGLVVGLGLVAGLELRRGFGLERWAAAETMPRAAAKTTPRVAAGS